ncbi:MAG: glycosyltransferase family 2 protein [bacterium]|nr:glycosyltransferase family 2 protein [bacterium]
MLNQKQIQAYQQHPAFTDPRVSASALRRTVAPDLWRLLEMVPGLITWGILLGSLVLSIFVPRWVAYGILLFDVYWLVKSVTLSVNLLRAYHHLRRDTRIDWSNRLKALERSIDSYAATLSRVIRRIDEGHTGLRKWLWFRWLGLTDRRLARDYRDLQAELSQVRAAIESDVPLPRASRIHHLVFVATYTEDLETLRPTFQAIVESAYDPERLIIVLATEERDKARARANARTLKREFGRKFKKLIVTEHPSNITGEVKGKGSNINWAGRQALKEIDRLGIPHEEVIVTTLDADHRPHPQYFAALTYQYLLAPDRRYRSFQPTPLFHNNLWYTTAINRILSTGTSFWHMIESTRPWRLRNFAAHSQGLQTVVDTDFWSIDTIVEDGQQYWRTYFRYDGRHFVQPVYVPVYQDAVLGDTYPGTLKEQYLQLRRWAYGASDFPYAVIGAWRNPRIPLGNKLLQIGRFLEGHVTWAVAPILITFVGWFPIFLSSSFRETLFGQTLAPTASFILTLALIGIIVTILVSLLLLPPKPPGYKERHKLLHVAQWVLMPVTTIVFSSLPAIESQTRLLFGRYLEFRVTRKRTKALRTLERRAKAGS